MKQKTEALCPMDGFPVSECGGFDCQVCEIYKELSAKNQQKNQHIFEPVLSGDLVLA